MRVSKELRVLTLLICASLLYTTTSSYCAELRVVPRRGVTLDELRERFPNARLVEVDMAEYRRIRDTGSSVTEYVSIPIEVAQAETEEPVPNDLSATVTTTNAVTNTVIVTNVITNVIQEVESPPSRVEYEARSARTAHTHSGDAVCMPVFDEGACNVAVDLMDCDFGSDADVVLFVIIGVVVVAALVIYTVGYLGSMAMGVGDYSYWWDMEVRSSFLVGGSESGAMAGLRLSSGIADAGVNAGIAIEGGFLDMEVELENSDDAVDLEGGYIMAGPAIRWGEAYDNPSYLSMELLAGTTEHEQVDVMSVARIGLSLGLGPVLRLGCHIGAMYLGLELDEGLVREDDNYTTILGGEFGVRF